MDQITKDLLAASKLLCDEVEYHDNHHPQQRQHPDDCGVCVALYEIREAIAKAEKQG